MNRYKCPKCKGNQYSSSNKKADEPCVYCGQVGTELMKEIEETLLNTTCPHCLGSGEIKVMQSAMTYNVGSIRVRDIEVKCIYCNGTGRRKDDK